MRVDFYRHDLGPKNAEAVAKVLSTPFLTSGAVCKAVESDLIAYFGCTHALMVNSWTNGAAATLMAMDIGPGHEVIVPAMTFIATSNVVELVGAKPIFVDVEPGTLLMTADAVKAALTPQTRAIIPVHLYGQMVDIAAIRAMLSSCGRSDVKIIEDCAHCFEGQIDGKRPGADSTAAIFSFYATKNVTCGEGGTIITNDDDLFAKIQQTRLHGMSAGAADRFKTGHYRHWDMARMGMKANLPDLLACLLPPQIATIDQRLPVREKLAQRYEAAFAKTPIKFQHLLPNRRHARHLFVIHVPPSIRDDVLTHMGTKEIGCTVNYRLVPTLTYYAKKYGYTPNQFPVSSAWGNGTLSLPFFPSMTKDEQDYVIDTLLKDVIPMIEKAA
ncbi:MAG: DegT/DnrJ/EryC1/StrS family aminotransferase [Bdellovibrionales bacterium]